jgi:nucleotide-binding universal stress UspA family protein
MDILFATDGRPPARAAADLLIRLVDPARVQVTVLHALEYGNEVVADEYARDVLADADASLGGAGIPTHLVSVDAGPAVAIDKEVAQGGQDLVVMGAGNHTWLGRLVFGSVSTHVLHGAPVPVLVVHTSPHVEHDRLKVLVGADGSPAAMGSIHTLLGMTDPDRIDVEVRTVLQTPTAAFEAYPGAVVPARYVEQALEQAREATSTNLERALQQLREAGFDPRGSIGEGWVGNDLLHIAEREQADLVVVGARGIGRLERLALGSVSAHVARHAPATLVAHAESFHSDEPVGAAGI